MESEGTMILYCRHCGHIWEYTGHAETETSCARCKKYVNISTQRLDQPLGPTGDYSDAEYLGVSEDGVAHYWDNSLGVAVWFDPETKRLEETDNSKDMTPVEYVMAVSEAMGWRYLRPLHEIRLLDEEKE